MAPRRATSAEVRGNSSGNNESATVENTPDSGTTNPPLSSMDDMQRELDEINAQRRRVQLTTSLEKARADRDAGFPAELLPTTLTIRPKEIDPLSLEKSFKTADLKTYTGTKQKDYKQLIRECLRTFNQKPITSEKNITKVLYKENCIGGTPADDWHREKPTLEKSSLAWKYFVDFLQEKLKSKHLRLLDLGGQLKKFKQRPGQTVELVSYLDILEDQLPEIPSESQRHNNLLNSLHYYLQRATIRANSQGTTRLALIEAARVAERVEPKPDFVRNATRPHYRSTNEERPQRAPSHQRTVTYNKASSSKTSETSKASTAQAAVNSPSRKRPREDTTDPPKITCWNCGKKGHKKSDCRAPTRKAGKA